MTIKQSCANCGKDLSKGDYFTTPHDILQEVNGDIAVKLKVTNPVPICPDCLDVQLELHGTPKIETWIKR
jgi:hypothetical protein